MGIISPTFENVRPLSSTAKQILNKRYMQEGEKTWDELVTRVMNYIVPKENDDYLPTKEMIEHRYFLPNSPCLANAGKEGAGLCACYVVDFKDTIEDIYKTKYDFALVARKGGGCGTTLSNLRPKGSNVKGSTHGYAGGPVAFADTISRDMSVITQGGLRPMAIMFTISVYHPDILDFILAKEKEENKKIENANMSVVVDGAFMEAVKADTSYWTKFNDLNYISYKARDIFNLIVEGAWRNGEPGILFQDSINESPYKYTGQKIQATNPCSEQPLPPSGVCNLGSLDLSKFLTKSKEMDFEKLEYATRLGTRFLDRVVDKSTYPTEEIAVWAKNNRAIGMGIMGFADYCLMKQIAYGSDESLAELDTILCKIHEWANDESRKLGRELGVPKECKKLPEPRRNITLTTVAPTGTVSLIAGCVIGDTEIHTIEGKKKIKDIVGTEQYVYSSGKDEILVKKAYNIRKTREKAEIWKIKFDTDDELILTPDHKIMLSDGTWKRTDELNFGDSIREFHKSIWTPQTTTAPSTALYMTNLPRKFNHIAVAEEKYNRKIGKNECVHHIDFNHMNDSRDNLNIISKTEHKKIHSNSMINWSKSNIGKTYEEIFGIEKAKKLKQDKSEKMSGERNHRYGYKLSDEEKELVSIKTKEAMARPDVREHYLEGIKTRKSGRNHKVVSVEFYGHEDVYNMEVEDSENYVANGVVVHNCSSGIEPIFSEITIRNDKTGTYVFEDKLADKPYFRCAVSSNGATEVTWEEHVRVLATAQKNIDSGVSKTINFPNLTHRETISKAIFMAWELGCKGIAVYRNGSRRIEVLTPKNIKKDLCPNCDTSLIIIANIKTCPSCGWKVKI